MSIGDILRALSPSQAGEGGKAVRPPSPPTFSASRSCVTKILSDLLSVEYPQKTEKASPVVVDDVAVVDSAEVRATLNELLANLSDKMQELPEDNIQLTNLEPVFPVLEDVLHHVDLKELTQSNKGREFLAHLAMFCRDIDNIFKFARPTPSTPSVLRDIVTSFDRMLESADEAKKTTSATRIQAMFRGHLGRKRAKAKQAETAAATRIQAMFRGHLGRKRAKAKQAETAARQLECSTARGGVYGGSLDFEDFEDFEDSTPFSDAEKWAYDEVGYLNYIQDTLLPQFTVLYRELHNSIVLYCGDTFLQQCDQLDTLKYKISYLDREGNLLQQIEAAKQKLKGKESLDVLYCQQLRELQNSDSGTAYGRKEEVRLLTPPPPTAKQRAQRARKEEEEDRAEAARIEQLYDEREKEARKEERAREKARETRKKAIARWEEAEISEAKAKKAKAKKATSRLPDELLALRRSLVASHAAAEKAVSSSDTKAFDAFVNDLNEKIAAYKAATKLSKWDVIWCTEKAEQVREAVCDLLISWSVKKKHNFQTYESVLSLDKVALELETACENKVIALPQMHSIKHSTEEREEANKIYKKLRAKASWHSMLRAARIMKAKKDQTTEDLARLPSLVTCILAGQKLVESRLKNLFADKTVYLMDLMKQRLQEFQETVDRLGAEHSDAVNRVVKELDPKAKNVKDAVKNMTKQLDDWKEKISPTIHYPIERYVHW